MDTETPNLSGANYRETFAYLCSQLPPPPDGTPAEASAERERRAMDAVVALTPMDAFEARLAARIVAMDDHAADSLRLAGLHPDDAMEIRRCRAQAASMARQSDSALPIPRPRPGAMPSSIPTVPRASVPPAACRPTSTSAPPNPRSSPLFSKERTASHPTRHSLRIRNNETKLRRRTGRMP